MRPDDPLKDVKIPSATNMPLPSPANRRPASETSKFPSWFRFRSFLRFGGRPQSRVRALGRGTGTETSLDPTSSSSTASSLSQPLPERSAPLSASIKVDPVVALAERLKLEIQSRFRNGECPEVAEYLTRYPALSANKEKVLSLIYEEFCLLEDRNLNPRATEFCERYPDWSQSLREQLDFHRMFSKVVEPVPATIPVRFPDPPEQFATFRIRAVLGQGGAARVYLATDETLGDRPVVLKISADRGNEASIHGRLDHSNIVPVLSVAHQPETNLMGLCMPYRPGLPLDRVIVKMFEKGTRPETAKAIWSVLAAATDPNADPDATKLPEGPGWSGFPIDGTFAEGVAWIVGRIASALQYAHDRGIYHRDVKPANILLTRTDGPQLLDFNLAHSLHSHEDAAEALRGGTLPYMAPEQLRAFRRPECWAEVGPASDVYSLAIVAREFLSGRPPVETDASNGNAIAKPLAQTINELYEQRTSVKPWPSLRNTNPKVPHALEAILDLCLAADVADRYIDAQTLAVDLGRFLERLPLRVARNPSRPERASIWVDRHRRFVKTSTAAALLLLTIAGAYRFTTWLTPFENRQGFKILVQRFESGNVDEARNGFDQLRAEGFDFPLLWIYLGATYHEGEIPAVILHKIDDAWNHPQEVAALDVWSNRHPGFLGVLEQLGERVLKRKAATPPSRDLAAERLVAAHLNAFVLEHHPKSYSSTVQRAVGLEYNGELAAAHQLFCDLIASSRGADRQAAESLERLRPVLVYRARVAIKWVDQAIRGEFLEIDPPRADQLLKEAFADLDESSRIVDKLRKLGRIPDELERSSRFVTNYILCEGSLVEGDLLRKEAKAAEAELAYRRSSGYLVEISPVALETDYYERLQSRVLERLTDLKPKSPSIGSVVPEDERGNDSQAAKSPSGSRS